MTKAEKIQILVAEFTKMRFPRNEGETDNQYVARTVQERVQKLKQQFLRSVIERGMPKVELDVSDL
jgi:hypothetical protein